MSWLLTRQARCKRCPEPCALQFDVAALAQEETVCPLRTWDSGAPGGRARVMTLPTGGGGPAKAAEEWGPRMWEELHRWALIASHLGSRRDWLADFAARIPRGCACPGHWAGMVARRPPPWQGSPAELFAWTVEIHNEVNARLGKPVLTVAAARERWGL